jgi:hypothetical protein
MDDQPIFSVKNNHIPQAGAPPHIDDSHAPQVYIGYYQNLYGEQCIFTYDRETKQGTLYMGDAGWEHAFEVRDGRVVGDLTLQRQEQLWLTACWMAATMTHQPPSKPGA